MPHGQTQLVPWLICHTGKENMNLLVKKPNLLFSLGLKMRYILDKLRGYRLAWQDTIHHWV